MRQQGGGERDQDAAADGPPAETRCTAFSDERKSSDRGVDVAEKKTDPRGLRGSVGSRKVPDRENKNAALCAAVSRLLLLRGLLRALLLLRWHSDHLLLAMRCSVYRHRHVRNVNSCVVLGRARLLAPKLQDHTLAELDRGDIRGAALAELLQEAGLEDEVV